jgi:hypothetical protein
VFINLYFLYKIYSKKDTFEIIATSQNEDLLHKFIEFHKNEIIKISPDFDFKFADKEYNYFITRNMALVGLFLAKKESDNTLMVGLDFVTPQYRDFKNGAFLYNSLQSSFKKSGINMIKAIAKTKAHANYLKEMGFKSDDNQQFTKHI